MLMTVGFIHRYLGIDVADKEEQAINNNPEVGDWNKTIRKGCFKLDAANAATSQTRESSDYGIPEN